MKHVRGDIDRLSLDLIGPASVVSQTADHTVQVPTRIVDRLSIIKRFDCGKQLLVLLGKVGQLVKQNASLLRCRGLPDTVKCSSSCVDSEVDVFLSALVDRNDDLFG